MTALIDLSQCVGYKRLMDWVWEILRYVAAWGGTGLIIWFWYWMFSNIGTF